MASYFTSSVSVFTSRRQVQIQLASEITSPYSTTSVIVVYSILDILTIDI